jgi:L-alanine-DL-glutamate epimerase-like enolase superfamily enzyme
MRLSIAVRELFPRRAFRIARVRRNPVRNVYVRLEAAGISGYGEASPNAFYNETADAVMEKLQAAAGLLETLQPVSVADIERAWEEIWTIVQPSRAAQCALDVALWDWLAKRKGMSACELAWGLPPAPVKSFATIGISTPEELREKVEELAGYPMVKVKSDAAAGLDTVRYVRAQLPDCLIAVDANCAWTGQSLPEISRELATVGVEFIEQPFPPDHENGSDVAGSALPVLADESCVNEKDVAAVAARFSGFNIKLVKCGGITPGLRMSRHGRGLGSKMMVGCMLESSALIAAGAVVAQQTHYADLDGAWLIGNDPFEGLPFDHGILRPGGPGLGVSPVPDLFGG